MIKEYLNRCGYSTVKDDFYTTVENWLRWYQGKVKSFHNYTVYNGKEKIQVERYSLGMPKKVCEDWANLLMNEKVNISVSENSLQETLNDILHNNNFKVRSNQLIELAFAMGTGAFVEYIDRDNVAIDYIRADMIYPLTWENGNIKECAFGSRKSIDGKEFDYINLHILNSQGTYEIHNVLLECQTGRKAELPEGIIPVINTGLETPSFQIIKPNVINNIDLDCPMGISVYANAIDIIKGIDLTYDSYINEFRLGKKRIIVPMNFAQLGMEKDGLKSPVFDSNDVEFVAMETNEEKQTIKEINMELRAEPHEKALQRNMNLLSSKVGLGNDRYNYDKGGLKTATEVVSEKSDLYQNLQKNEIIIEKALIDMVKQIALLSGFTSDFEVNIGFDDSIIEDDAAIQQRALLEFQSGIIDAAEYLSITRKMDRETAEKKALEMQKDKTEKIDTEPFGE